MRQQQDNSIVTQLQAIVADKKKHDGDGDRGWKDTFFFLIYNIFSLSFPIDAATTG